MTLLLARHAECVANAERLHVGRQESQLTSRGCRQAERIAAALSQDGGLQVVRVVSSPLGRARLTAEAIAAALAARSGLSVEVETDDRFVEFDYGELEGRSVDEKLSPAFERWRFDASVPVPGGESLGEAAGRVGAACTELTGAATAGASPEAAARLGRDAGDVVVVSHVIPIKLAACWAIGCEPLAIWRMDLAVASLTRLAGPPGSPRLAGYNEHAYLGEDATPPIWR